MIVRLMMIQTSIKGTTLPGSEGVAMATIYDPPSGWMFGFPKRYKPHPGDTIVDTLIRDGYPVDMIFDGMANYVRFWEYEEQEIPRQST